MLRGSHNTVRMYQRRQEKTKNGYKDEKVKYY